MSGKYPFAETEWRLRVRLRRPNPRSDLSAARPRCRLEQVTTRSVQGCVVAKRNQLCCRNSYRCIINSFTIFLNFSIRENIVDEFTCDGRSYGYYADVANDCQVSLNLENLAYFREMAIIFTLSCSTSVTRWLTLMDKRRCSSGVSSALTRPSLTRLTFKFLQLPKPDHLWPGWP